MLHLRTTRPSCCKLQRTRNQRSLLTQISATALAQAHQVLEEFQAVSAVAPVVLVEDMVVVLDSVVVADSAAFLALLPATSVVDQTTMRATARLRP
jgi:hypothetical protein